MAIPKYQREKVSAQTRVEQFGGLEAEAEARGQAGIAQAQKGLGAQYGQRARQEVANLNQRLSDFSRQVNQIMGTSAQKMGTEKAANDIKQKQHNILKIQSDASLTPEEKALRIDEARVDVTNDYFSVYGNAYNNVVEADYNNTITVESAEKAQEIAETTNGNPEAFKQAFEKYKEKMMDGAPSPISQLTGSRAYDAAGLAMYKSLYSKRNAAFNKEAKANSKNAAATLSNQYQNAISSDRVNVADEAMSKYAINRQAAANAGYTTKSDATNDVFQLKIKGQKSKLENIFESSKAEGNELETLEAIKSERAKGAYDSWSPGAYESMELKMETEARTRGNMLLGNTLEVYKSGKIPSAKETEMAMKYMPLLSESKQAEYRRAKSGSEMYHGIKQFDLNKQLAAVNQGLAKPDLGRDSIEALTGAKKIINNKIQKSKVDPVSLGADDEMYSIKPLTPTALSIEDLTERGTQALMSASRYKTEPKFFTTNEVETFTTYVNNPQVSIQDKLDLIGKIDTATGGQGMPAYQQLSKKGASVFSVAADLVSEGSNTTAAQMMQGSLFLNDDSVQIRKTDIDNEIRNKVGAAIMYMGQGDGAKISKSIQSLVAYKIAQNGGDIDDSGVFVEDAMNEIMGERERYNDLTFFAPKGVDADDVVDFIDDLTVADVPSILGVIVEDTVDAIQRSQLVYVGNNKYQFIFNEKRLLSPDRTPYELEYAK